MNLAGNLTFDNATAPQSDAQTVPVSNSLDSNSLDHYELRCLDDQTVLNDTRGENSQFPLSNPGATRPAFLRTIYQSRAFSPDTSRDDLFRYQSWLPVRTALPGSGRPVTWRALGLGEALGLSDVWVTFSGWWPERGARIPTGTFKECEAYAVYARMDSAATDQTLVVASAGNTARAFLRVASELSLPLVVVIPEPNVSELWTVGERSSSTTVVAVRNAESAADYGDAIEVAASLNSQPGFLPEGGARNVARRDGMGTTFLSAVEAIGALPNVYIQAVGSGTGAIAAWEAALRVQQDGRYGSQLPELHLAQNAPFAPLVDSWEARSRTLLVPPPDTSRALVEAINAKVLANRQPPWGLTGGLFDALSATLGTMYALTNDNSHAAGQLFEESEGIDISPAARVACAALVAGLERGTIKKNQTINLNITGGGWKRARAELDTRPLVPDIVVEADTLTGDQLAETIRRTSMR